MTPIDLKEFLLNRMSMSHIYQPLVVRVLLENDGKASVRKIAAEFLAYDEAQVEYYINIVKRWPKITLSKHGIIDTTLRGFFRLQVDFDRMTEAERAELIGICNEKIKGYIAGYKGIIGDYRYNPEDLSSSSTRYLVLKLANGKCALCGASVRDKPIDVDHIIPRNKGGSNDISNLQALCYECNRAKRDRDSQDFRTLTGMEHDANCIFCSLDTRVTHEYNSALCVRDEHPVTPFHSLIIPRRHVLTLGDLPLTELSDLFQLAKVVKQDLRQLDKAIGGFNFGINEGATAGQTVSHLHLHLIPRRAGDVADPRGGVRGVIPDKAFY